MKKAKISLGHSGPLYTSRLLELPFHRKVPSHRGSQRGRWLRGGPPSLARELLEEADQTLGVLSRDGVQHSKADGTRNF